MYDITNINSLNIIPKWIRTIRENKWIQSRRGIPIFLVGNKVDLQENREVSKGVAINIKNEHNLARFMEISSRTRVNIDKMFDEITRLIHHSLMNS